MPGLSPAGGGGSRGGLKLLDRPGVGELIQRRVDVGHLCVLPAANRRQRLAVSRPADPEPLGLALQHPAQQPLARVRQPVDERVKQLYKTASKGGVLEKKGTDVEQRKPAIR